jgi:hypothetical protein
MDEVHPAGSVVSEAVSGRPLLQPVHEKYGPPRSMAKYHLIKRKRRVMKAQEVFFTNGCPK